MHDILASNCDSIRMMIYGRSTYKIDVHLVELNLLKNIRNVHIFYDSMIY